LERKSCNRRFVPQNLRYRASWLEVRTPHFRVISNAPEKEAQRAALKFERMRSVFARVFPDRNIDTAEFGLANAFFAGKDIPKDESKGARCWNEPRDGLPEAQFQMAERAYGTGSNPETYVAAYVWYALAQRSGYDPSQGKAEVVASEMTPEQLSEAQKELEKFAAPPPR
jgi:hypothetical protein